MSRIATLLVNYERWKARAPADSLRLHLGWSKGRSAEHTRGSGTVEIGFAAGIVGIEVAGLAEHDRVDVWFVPWRHAGSAGREQPATRVAAIALDAGRGRAVLPIDAELASLELDRVVVCGSGARPSRGGLLYGSPTLFDRMRSLERRGAGARSTVGGVHLTPSLSGPTASPVKPFDERSLVEIGEQLFFEETFSGNGRTCGTCHPAENNFTLDPDFIATLPPSDPLFVAENLPALNSDLNGGLVFENPILMREFGLIVENPDGFDDPQSRFVMRGVQHVLGLANTISPPPFSTAVTHLVGWSGDGSVGSGSLREFATGAVRQHFPLTMDRVPGVDFRFPTPSELNALEAFLLSLGRPADPNFSMTLLDAGAAAGKNRFLESCAVCHENAGANANFFLGNGGVQRDTGVEAFTQSHPDGSGELRPPDGGFGTNPTGGFESVSPNADGSFGDRTFNAQSLVELADTLPAFHSNLTAIPNTGLTDTVEGAIEFYTTDEFAAAVGGPIELSAGEIADLGRFLRVLNALENLRTMEDYGERARNELKHPPLDLARATSLVLLAAEESRDVLEVLGEVELHPAAIAHVATVESLFESAATGSVASRLAAIEEALEGIAAARAEMVVE